MVSKRKDWVFVGIEGGRGREWGGEGGGGGGGGGSVMWPIVWARLNDS